MITVRALPPSFDAEYARAFGEGLFCDEWDYDAERHGIDTCSARAEIEITRRESRKWQWTVRLCREHAGYLATQLAEAIELADGGDLMRASR